MVPRDTVLRVPLARITSQYSLSDESEARSGCGITCLWSVLSTVDPSFMESLESLNTSERAHAWHYRPEDGLWLQQGSAVYARSRGLKAMAVNLTAMGGEPSDIDSMLHSGRLSEGEIDDYLLLFQTLQPIDDFTGRVAAALSFGLERRAPVMVGVNPGHGEHAQTHRIVCSGLTGDSVDIFDPLDRPAAIKSEPLSRLAEYTTGNLLFIYQ